MFKKIYDFLTTKYMDAYCKVILPLYIFLRLSRFVQYSFDIPVIEEICSLLRHICLVLIFIGLISNFLKNKNISIGNMAIVIVGLIEYLILRDSSNTYIVTVGIILESIRNQDKKPIFKTLFILYASLFILNVILTKFGYIIEWSTCSLGFIYYTDACSIFFATIAAYYFIKERKLEYRDLIVVLACVILFYTSNGRNTFYSSIILVLLAIFASLFKGKLFDKIKYLFVPLPFVLLLLTLWLTNEYMQGTNLGLKLNEVFTTRLSLNAQGLQEYGINFWGHIIEENGLGNPGYDYDAYFYIDSGYMSLLLHIGLIPTIIILLLYSASLFHLAKTNNYTGLILVVVFLIFYFTESFIFTPERNIAVLLLAENFNLNIDLGKAFDYASKKLA